jgi:hypothetical protein
MRFFVFYFTSRSFVVQMFKIINQWLFHYWATDKSRNEKRCWINKERRHRLYFIEKRHFRSDCSKMLQLWSVYLNTGVSKENHISRRCPFKQCYCTCMCGILHFDDYSELIQRGDATCSVGRHAVTLIRYAELICYCCFNEWVILFTGVY